MTTVAYRDGVLAADTLVISGSSRAGHMSKLLKTRRGALVGISGEVEGTTRFLDWMRSGRRGKPPATDDDSGCRGIVVEPDGSVLFWDGGPALFPKRGAYFALGSGRDVALGALAMGATADAAVRAAMQIDIYTGGDVETLRLED
jgi:ATP-dependent HslUV protease subunit HslV